jgi:CHASE3 domain sensor protein
MGGIFFTNGTAFVTDILLLALAAIFMNWSVRLPWDWYYSAQAQLREVEPEEYALADDVDNDETAVESASSAGNSPKQVAQPDESPEADSKPSTVDSNTKRKLEAAAELRRQETLALISTFIFPVMAAYLLHAIRSQLSNTSTALVSDFNLSIFVLAAEIRPFQQLIRLLSSRTLHLQRIVTGDGDQAAPSSNAVKNLESRIAELEMLLADQSAATSNGSMPQRSDVADMIAAEIKKRAEPRFDALERAMRRYEKRSTTLSMLTEQRLNTHESRIQDSLSLAAAAAQRSQNRGALATVVDSIWNLIGVPLKLATELALWPFHVVNLVYLKLRELLHGRGTPKSGKRSGPAQPSPRDEKGRVVQRKSVR